MRFTEHDRVAVALVILITAGLSIVPRLSEYRNGHRVYRCVETALAQGLLLATEYEEWVTEAKKHRFLTIAQTAESST